MEVDKQVLYKGRWVARDSFRTFVFNSTGMKLAKSYQEFSDMISSGVWFADAKDIPSKEPAANEEDNVIPLKDKRGPNVRANNNRK